MFRSGRRWGPDARLDPTEQRSPLGFPPARPRRPFPFAVTPGDMSIALILPALLALTVTCLVGAVMHRAPRVAVSMWLLTIAFVPIWLGVGLPLYFYPASLVGILVMVAILPLKVGLVGPADLMIGMFFIACLAPVIGGGATITTVFVATTQWIVAFLVGRLLSSKVSFEWIYSCVGLVFSAVATLALIEFFSGWNPFVGLGPVTTLHLDWASLQGRGGLVRAEGAFGHSIALGSSLALAIPLTMASSFRPPIRILMSVLMLCAVAVTLSRVSMLDAALAMALAVGLVGRGISRAARIGGIFALLVVTVSIAPFVSSVLATAGEEATRSAGYRSSLTDLIPFISPLGFSSVASRTSSGELYFGRFQSIDSQLILIGLTYGWAALVCAIVLLAVAVTVVLRRHASPGTVAIVAQIPALVTVALITQYSMFFWFVVGLAAAGQMRSSVRVPTEAGGEGEQDGEANPIGSARRVA